MPSTATVTAKTGPAIQDTAIVLTNVSSFNADIASQVLTVVSNGLIKTYDLNGVTTFTVSISSGVYTITIS